MVTTGVAAVHMAVPIALESHQKFTLTLFQRVEEGGIAGLMQLGEKGGDRRTCQDYVASTSSQVGIVVLADCDLRSVN